MLQLLDLIIGAHGPPLWTIIQPAAGQLLIIPSIEGVTLLVADWAGSPFLPKLLISGNLAAVAASVATGCAAGLALLMVDCRLTLRLLHVAATTLMSLGTPLAIPSAGLLTLLHDMSPKLLQAGLLVLHVPVEDVPSTSLQVWRVQGVHVLQTHYLIMMSVWQTLHNVSHHGIIVSQLGSFIDTVKSPQGFGDCSLKLNDPFMIIPRVLRFES